MFKFVSQLKQLFQIGWCLYSNGHKANGHLNINTNLFEKVVSTETQI